MSQKWIDKKVLSLATIYANRDKGRDRRYASNNAYSNFINTFNACPQNKKKSMEITIFQIVSFFDGLFKKRTTYFWLISRKSIKNFCRKYDI